MDDGAKPARDAAHLHVVGGHHDHLVARFDEVPERDAVGLRSAVGDLDVLGSCTGIQHGNRRAKLGRAVRLRVAELLGEERHAFGFADRELFEPERVHAAFREIPGHTVLPDRLQTFQQKWFELHFGRSVLESIDARVPTGAENKGALSCVRMLAPHAC